MRRSASRSTRRRFSAFWACSKTRIDALGSGFRSEGDVIRPARRRTAPARASPTRSRAREFSSSEYAKTIHGIVAGAPPAIDLAAEKRLIECLVKLASEKAILSAHDVSDGGLAVTLAECCFAAEGLSADVSLAPRFAGISAKKAALNPALFGERGARAVVSSRPLRLPASTAIAAQYGVKSRARSAQSRAANFASNIKGAPVIAGSRGFLSQDRGANRSEERSKTHDVQNPPPSTTITSTTIAAFSAFSATPKPPS